MSFFEIPAKISVNNGELAGSILLPRNKTLFDLFKDKAEPLVVRLETGGLLIVRKSEIREISLIPAKR